MSGILLGTLFTLFHLILTTDFLNRYYPFSDKEPEAQTDYSNLLRVTQSVSGETQIVNLDHPVLGSMGTSSHKANLIDSLIGKTKFPHL